MYGWVKKGEEKKQSPGNQEFQMMVAASDNDTEISDRVKVDHNLHNCASRSAWGLT